MERQAHPFFLTWTDSRGVHRRELTRPFTIGRTPENDIMLDAPSVSRRHCVVTPRGAYIEVDASMSTNLVQSGGRRVATVRLSPGGSFTVGGTTFAVEAVGAAAPRQAAPVKRAMKPAQLGAIAGAASLGVLVVLAVAVVALTSGGGGTGTGTDMVSQHVAAAEGGVVAMPGGPSVTFPPGALDQDTTVTIREAQSAPASDGNSLGSVYEIDAGEAVLVEPATLRVPFDRSRVEGELNSDAVVLSYYDENLRDWQQVDSVIDLATSTVAFETEHFSKWQVQTGTSGASVNFALPYDKSNVAVRYVGGPHARANPPSAYCQKTRITSSGVDFGSRAPLRVLAIAPGRVVDIHLPELGKPEKPGAGYWVTLEHDNGLQSSYWHLQDRPKDTFPPMNVDDRVPQGFPVGNAGKSGGQAAVHAHIELERGHQAGDPYSGAPVSWHGRSMDGWTLWMHLVNGDSSIGYSYQGSATKGTPTVADIKIANDSASAGCVLASTTVTAHVGGQFDEGQEQSKNDDCALKVDDSTRFACDPGKYHLPSANCERHVVGGGCVDGSSPPLPSPEPSKTPPPVSPTDPVGQVPAAPSQASIKAIDKNTVEVSWKPASTNHTGVRVYGTGGTRLIEASASFTSIRINGFSPGEQVCVNVRAFNSAGESGNAYAGCATTSKEPAAQPPAAPSQASIKAIDKNTVEVSWKSASTNHTGFRVYGTGGTFLMEASASFTSLRINGFSPREQVCVNVRAFNSAGESGNAYAGCATTPKDPAAQPPAAPSQASIKAIDKNTVEVSWKSASTNHTGFRVYGTAGTFLMEGTGSSLTSLRINGFSPGEQVCVNVRAFNSAGESGNTYAGCATTSIDPAAQVPAAPSNVAIWPEPTLHLAWNDSSNNESGFRIYANGALFHILSAGMTSLPIIRGTDVYVGNVELVGTVCFAVSAYNSAGESARVGGSGNACHSFSVSYSLTLDLNDLPDGHTFTIGQGISLCYWLTPSNVPYGVRLFKSTNGSQYELISQWTDTGGGDCVDSTVGSPAGTRTYLAQAVVNGSVVAEDTTFIQIVATGGGGDQPGGTCEVPTQPSGLSATNASGGMLLSWQAVPAGACASVSYVVSNEFFPPFTAEVTGTSYLVSSAYLKDGLTNCINVAAMTAAGKSGDAQYCFIYHK